MDACQKGDQCERIQMSREWIVRDNDTESRIVDEIMLQMPKRSCSGCRPERRVGRNQEEWHAHSVVRVLPDGVPPPVEGESAFDVLQEEENEHEGEGEAGVERSGEDVVVAHPPPEVEATHEPLEEAANHDPRGVVDTRCRRHLAKTGEKDGSVDISPKGVRVLARKKVKWNGKDGTHEEEPQNRAVPANGE